MNTDAAKTLSVAEGLSISQSRNVNVAFHCNNHRSEVASVLPGFLMTGPGWSMKRAIPQTKVRKGKGT